MAYAESDSVCDVDGGSHEHDYNSPVLDSYPPQYFCKKCRMRFFGKLDDGTYLVKESI